MSEYNSDYDVRLATLDAMGGETARTFNSVYDVDLAILEAVEEGGGGGGTGGATAIEMTQAQYDAAKEAGTLKANAIYIITDAQEIDMDDYYTKDEVDDAIDEATADKADAVSVTAGNGWPSWNSQGIITGRVSTLYSIPRIVNGTYYYFVQTNNSGSYQGMYVPTSVGSNGQVLQSVGSGAPQWKDGVTTSVDGGVKIQKITEAEYEALSTKDANTLYLVTVD